MAFAQPRSPSDRLTLDEALQLADANHPRLKAAGAASEAARASIVTAKAYRNPEINVGGFGAQQSILQGTPGGSLAGFVISQPLELPAVRRSRIAAAERAREGSEYAIAEARLAVRGGVRQSFYHALRQKAEVEVALANLQLIEDLRLRIDAQVNAGEAARLELIRADAEVASARIQVQSAELRLSGALSALQAAIGVPVTAALDPVGQLDDPLTLPPLHELREEVLAAHPSIALAEAQRRQAAELLNLERAARRPAPTVWADLFRQPDAIQYRAGVTLPIPVWDRRAGPVAEAVASERQTAALVELRRIEISAALDRAYRQYEVANQQVQMFEAGILRGAEAAVRGAQSAFQYGERGIIEVLDAQRVLRSARQDFLNAQYDRQAALIELEQLGAVRPRRP